MSDFALMFLMVCGGLIPVLMMVGVLLEQYYNHKERMK